MSEEALLIAYVGRWYAMWQEGGMKALRGKSGGAPKGSNLCLNQFEQERIRKTITREAPDQLKLPFALWTRQAVREFIEEIYDIELPIKRAYERNDKKVRQWLEEEFPALSKRAQAEGAEVH